MSQKNIDKASPYTIKLVEGLNLKFVGDPRPTKPGEPHVFTLSLKYGTGYDEIMRVLGRVNVFSYCFVDRVTGDVLPTRGKEILYNVATEEGYQELLNSKTVLVTRME